MQAQHRRMQVLERALILLLSFKNNVISFLLADSAFLVADQCGVAQMKAEYPTKCCPLMESCSLCNNSHNSHLKNGKNHYISSTVAKYSIRLPLRSGSV